ncbi:MAG: hypothetical protein K2N61_06185 [Lachnospiraceae bacterium]|nr:hypothetical protein [Lachnospiraceae bacterium]
MGVYYLEIAKNNLRHNSLLSVIAAVILCLLVPLFIGTANLDKLSAAMPLEMFVSLIGVILLTPVFGPEQNEEIRDLTAVKYFGIRKIYCIRTVYSAVIIVLLIGLFFIYMNIQNCEVTPMLAFGTIADALFLGGMGMFVSAVSDNTVIGYMPPLFYYALNFGMGEKLGKFYLFSMAAGEYKAKLWMLAAGVLLIFAALFYQYVRRD